MKAKDFQALFCHIFLILVGSALAQARRIDFVTQNINSGVVNPKCVAVGDFNNDGNTDLVLVNNINSVAVLLGNGDGTFQNPVIYALDFYVAGCVVVGDFNGDGNADVVVVGSDSSENSLALLTGNGDGTLNSPVYFRTTLGGAGVSMAVGDLNGDNNPDIFIGGNGSSEVVLGDGAGGFQQGAYFGGVYGFGVALGDFNGDGNLDVVATAGLHPSFAILLGNGDGSFEAPVTYTTMYNPTGVAVADFTGDQKLDFALTVIAAAWIYLGNGDGAFTSAGEWGGAKQADAIVSADFNEDGKIDLAMSDYTGGRVCVMPGKGNGTFPSTQFFDTGPDATDVTTSDFNNDGSPDLAVTNSGSNTVSILLNTAGTKVELTSVPNPSTSGQTVTFTATVIATVTPSVTPTGTVQFRNGSTLLGTSPISHGTASFVTSGLEPGAHKISATFTGDSTFNPSTSKPIAQIVK